MNTDNCREHPIAVPPEEPWPGSGSFVAWRENGFLGHLIGLLPHDLPPEKLDVRDFVPDPKGKETRPVKRPGGVVEKIPGTWVPRSDETKRPMIGKAPGHLNGKGVWKATPRWRETPLVPEQIVPAEKSGGNVGLLTARFPSLDIDIKADDERKLAEIVHRVASEVLGDGPVRFREDSVSSLRLYRLAEGAEPFPKTTVVFTPPGGAEPRKLEFLGDGQQAAVGGRHPAKGMPLLWTTMPVASALPEIDAAKVAEFVERVEAALREAGCTIGAGKKRSGGASTRDGDDEVMDDLTLDTEVALESGRVITVQEFLDGRTGHERCHVPAKYREGSRSASAFLGLFRSGNPFLRDGDVTHVLPAVEEVRLEERNAPPEVITDLPGKGSVDRFNALGITFEVVSARTKGGKSTVKVHRTSRNVELALVAIHGDALKLDDRAGAISFRGKRMVEGTETNFLAAGVCTFLGWESDPDQGAFLRGIAGAAGRNAYDPVVKYLDSLTAPRPEDLGDIWERAAIRLGVAADDLEEVKHDALLLRMWFISATQRARNPGEKSDCSLILTGSQGRQKTMFLETITEGVKAHEPLAPPFVRGSAKLQGKDARIALQGPWVVELAELATVKKAENEVVKAFLDEKVDWYRPPYAAGNVARPRRISTAGTSNDEEFSTDSTGARRYWPVRVVSKIDMAWFVEHRDLLWAVADAAGAAGEKWWFPEDPEWLKERHAEAHEEGVLDEEVEAVVQDCEKDWAERGWFKLTDVVNLLSRERAVQVGNGRAVSDKLKRLGFKKTRLRVEGKAEPTKVWVRPKWLVRRVERAFPAEKLGPAAMAAAIHALPEEVDPLT